MNKKTIAALAFTLASLATISSSYAHLEPKKNDDMEKCYGVVKSGKNDCASAANKHSCAGMGKQSNDANEWIKLPKGLCDKETVQFCVST